MSDDCIFCKIIKGEIPSQKIYEDRDFYAFMDIKPISRGHALVIPKVHCRDVLDFPKTEETDFVEVVKKIARAVVKATGADAFNLGMNNGAEAGQIVFHAHMHIIPRYKGDGLRSWPHIDLPQEEMDAIHKKVLEELGKA